MRLLIISDSHDNIVRLKHSGEFAKANNMPVVHCGDWSSVRAVKILLNLGVKLFTVLGNADIEPGIKDAMRAPNVFFSQDFLEFEVDGRKILVCHYPDKIKDAVKSQKYDAIFCGHKHSKYKEIFGKTLVARPGALHRTSLPSFAVYDTLTNDVEFVDLAV